MKKSVKIFLVVCCWLAAVETDAQSVPSILKQYYFVLLTKGPNRSQDSITAAKIQNGHLANINKLHSEGKIDIAGPFADECDWRGIFIFNVSTQEEVEQLLKEDPAISSGRLNFTIHPWLSPKNACLK